MRKLVLYSTILLASFALVFGINGNAQALICDLSQVSGSIDCADGDDGNVDMNGNSIFGYSDWIYLSKQETPGSFYEPIDIDLFVDPISGTNSGFWSFNSDIWNIYDEIVIVLKDGGVGPDKIKWFAYLLEEGVSSGTWEYPDCKILSGLSVYGRIDGTSVPDASVMLLLGSSFLGFAVFSRKSKKS